MMKKALTVLFVLFITLACCFANGQNETGDETITLRFSWWGGDARHQATLAAIDKYTELNPNIRIEAEYGGFSSYYEKLITQLASDTAPDIIQIDYKWVHDLADQGKFFVDLAKETNGLMDISGFDQAFMMDYCSDDGYLLGVPAGINALILTTNEDLLSANGLSGIDWTWESLMDEGARFHSANPDKYLLGIQPQHFMYVCSIMLKQMNGNTLILDDGNLGFTVEEIEKIFSYIKEGLDKGVFAPFEETVLYDNVGWEQTPAWLNGEYGFVSNWVAGTALSVNACSFNVGVTRFPTFEGSTHPGLMVTPGTILSVNENSKYKEEAIKFVNWMINDPEAIMILADCRGVPATEEARNILSEADALDPLVSEGVNISTPTSGKPDNSLSLNSEITTILKETVLAIGYERLTPHEAAVQITEELTAKVAEITGN